MVDWRGNGISCACVWCFVRKPKSLKKLPQVVMKEGAFFNCYLLLNCGILDFRLTSSREFKPYSECSVPRLRIHQSSQSFNFDSFSVLSMIVTARDLRSLWCTFSKCIASPDSFPLRSRHVFLWPDHLFCMHLVLPTYCFAHAVHSMRYTTHSDLQWTSFLIFHVLLSDNDLKESVSLK